MTRIFPPLRLSSSPNGFLPVVTSCSGLSTPDWDGWLSPPSPNWSDSQIPSRWRPLSVILACLAVAVTPLTACGHSNRPSGSAPPAAMPTTVAHPPAQFIAEPCPNTPQPVPLLQGAHCGTLTVPENRTKADGGTLRLAVAIVPSETQPAADDPIVFLQGGPGADAIVSPVVPKDVGINHSRDLILMGQRGNYTSQPALTCAELDQFSNRRVAMVLDAPSTGDAYAQAAGVCHDRLGRSADLAAFNSTESAYDLIDLRHALGIGQWNVFSHSYGTELAVIYMHLDPNGIRSAALDGVTPPSRTAPGWAWPSVKQAFDNMTNACVAQTACNARYPDLRQTFIDQVKQLEAHPVTTTINVPDVGDTKVVLDGGALLDWFSHYGTHLPTEFPAAVDELAHGNPQRIALRYALASVQPADTPSIFGWGLSLSVMCSEWVPAESVDDDLRLAQQAFPDFPDSVKAQPPQFGFLRQACNVWNVPKAPEAVLAETDSPIPTLVLTGSYDAATGAQLGRYEAQYLSHSIVVTVPGAAHGVFVNPCGAKVIASFFNAPQQPDTSCVNTTQPPPYAINPPLP
jgi:pimeloyl-ACP methyl ester carboxylesterase